MKTVLVVALVVAFALPAAAFDLGTRAPAKLAGNATALPPDPAVLRQGGDTIEDAVRVPIPSIDLVGTNVGYGDDYGESCPYGGGTSPDVVYSILPDRDMGVNLDMYGSSYDTKVFVYDQDLQLIACNDDFYPDYTSFIENMPVVGGLEYFVVVDGYFGDAGDYLLDIVEWVPCVIECPVGAVLEGEPPLTVNYDDLFNGGCNTHQANPPFQTITAPLFCGVSGFYSVHGDLFSRDTDWFLIDIPQSGVLEITGDAEESCFLFELGPQDCDDVAVVQDVIIGKCAEASMTITGEPGATVWFWVGPTAFASPDGADVYEFDYVLELNLDPVATENHSWSDVKSLFD